MNALRKWLRNFRCGSGVPARGTRLAVELLEDRTVPSTFTVTNINDSGLGSLRQAIVNANAHSGLDTIAFSVAGSGVHTIALRSALPAVTDPVVIDGSTQPGYVGQPLIELNGATAGTQADGLHITAGSSTVRGLTINRFGDAQIRLDTLGNDIIAGDYLGTDATGTHAFPGAGAGIAVSNSTFDRIGGLTRLDRNLIAAHFASDGTSTNAIDLHNVSFSLIENNYIGLDVTGMHALSFLTQLDGILVSGGQGDMIGAPGAGNVVSNGENGIVLSGTTNCTVQNNYVGTDATGLHALGNSYLGVSVWGAASSDTIAANVISGNGLGLQIQASSANHIQGNLIGVDASGRRALGNGDDGVLLMDDAFSNWIGGSGPGQGNVIAANRGNGIEIYANLSAGSFENHVQGNFIGTDRSGTLHLGNAHAGVLLQADDLATLNSYGNEIGGSAAWLNGSWGPVAAGAGNVIAYNGGAGVKQLGYRMFNNPIRGNSIHDNGGLPIDLQTQPSFTPVVQFAQAGSTTTVDGYVRDTISEELLVDFYASNPSEFGQGRRYLGSTVVQASAFVNGVAPLSAHVGGTMPGEVVTATATGYYGNTTELTTGVPAWADLSGNLSILQTATGHEADGRAVVVALRSDSAVYLRVETAANSSVYGPWQPLYGSGVKSVRVTTDHWGRLQVLVIGSNTALWVNGQLTPNGTSWSGWQSLHGSQLKQIEVDTNYAGLPVVFAIGGNNAVYFQWESSPGNWSGWYNGVGGNLSSIPMKSISVGRDPAGRLQVFGLDQSGYPYVSTQTFPGSLTFTSWHYLGGNVQQLSATTDASGRVTLFALGDNNAVYWQQEDTSGNWSGWQPLYGYVKSITAGRDALGRMEVLAVGFDGQVYALRQMSANGSWGNWSAGFGGTVAPGMVTLGYEANGTLDVNAEFAGIDTTTWGYIRL
jgi:parallel beta-helix repeat protein